MIRLLCISCLLFHAFIGWSQAKPGVSGDSLLLTPYQGYGIELQVPAAWEVTQDFSRDIQVMFTNTDTSGEDSTFENIALFIEQARFFCLRSYFKLSKRNIARRLLGVKFLSEGENQINQYPSRWMILTHRYAGRTFKIKYYYFLKSGIAYIILLTTSPEDFEEHVKIGEQVLQTLRITK